TPSGPRTRRSGSGFGSGFGSGSIGPPDDEDSVQIGPDDYLFDRYRLIRKLGDGGMGSVWLVEHLGLQEQRALKGIKSDIAENETNQRRFQQEARIQVKLSKHPNAVPVHDAGFTGKFAYIEMDYVEGQTLKKRLEQTGPMPAEDVLWALGEVCAVLGEA